MNIFVVGTGRCGTSTFFQACQYVTNYTSGHESEAGNVPKYDFPINHIEISSQLVIAIPHLLKIYPDSMWVWMKRDKNECVDSLVENCNAAMRSYALQWFQTALDKKNLDMKMVCSHFYNRVNELCGSLLSPERTLYFDLDYGKECWTDCWNSLKFEGNHLASLKEWEKKYNATGFRGRNNYLGRSNEQGTST